MPANDAGTGSADISISRSLSWCSCTPGETIASPASPQVVQYIPYDALSAKTPMPNLALPHRDVDVWLITLTLPDDLACEVEAHGLLTPMAS